MPNIDSLTSPLRDLWNRVTTAGSPPASPKATASGAGAATRSRADIDDAYDKALDRLPDPSIALVTILAKQDPVATKLDELQTTLKGPYTVMGATVEAGAQFRMVGGYNQQRVSSTSDDGRLLAKVAEKAGLSSELGALQEGRGNPRSLVKLTQALIDVGQVPGGLDRSLNARIHDMQWRFGIGMDCAGYVYQAVAAIHGDPAKLGLKPTGFENFTGLPSNPHFTKVKAPEEARAGDVLVLAGDGTRANPGHNLIVRSCTALKGDSTLVDRWIGAAPFVGKMKDVYLLEVDSSFSAGESGSSMGGVRRDVLLYDTDTKQWCTCRDTDPPFAHQGPVPYGEVKVTGFFRAGSSS